MFGNDSACDWIYELEDEGAEHIERTLDRVIDERGYLEGPEGDCGLAAAETVARILGRPGQADAYTESLDAWIAANRPAADDALVAKARAAVERVAGADSELVELWSGQPEWLASVDGLRQRLGASA